MNEKRTARAVSLLEKLASDFIERELGLAGVLATVTRVEISKTFREAKIFVSVWPEKREKEVLSALAGLKKEFYEYMKKNFKVKYMPHFDFLIDQGERARQRVEEVLNKKKRG